MKPVCLLALIDACVYTLVNVIFVPQIEQGQICAVDQDCDYNMMLQPGPK